MRLGMRIFRIIFPLGGSLPVEGISFQKGMLALAQGLGRWAGCTLRARHGCALARGRPRPGFRLPRDGLRPRS
jgi:hypothetical protein